MRYVVGLVWAMGVMPLVGCSETGNSGGSGGHGGAAGQDGAEGKCWLGAAGGAGELQPGLYESGDDEGYEDENGNPIEDPNEACFHVNDDCTGLTPSVRCDAGGDGFEPQPLGITWVNGRIMEAPNPEVIDEPCTGTLAITAEMVSEVPIGESGFTFVWIDDDGTTWELRGDYGTSQASVRASRRDADGTVCSPFDIVFNRHWVRVSRP